MPKPFRGKSATVTRIHSDTNHVLGTHGAMRCDAPADAKRRSAPPRLPVPNWPDTQPSDLPSVPIQPPKNGLKLADFERALADKAMRDAEHAAARVAREAAQILHMAATHQPMMYDRPPEAWEQEPDERTDWGKFRPLALICLASAAALCGLGWWMWK